MTRTSHRALSVFVLRLAALRKNAITSIKKRAKYASQSYLKHLSDIWFLCKTNFAVLAFAEIILW